MMINCKKASELISKKIDNKLTLKEKMSLLFHKIMCKACRNFETESKLISECLQNKTNQAPILSEEKKKALQKAINESKKN